MNFLFIALNIIALLVFYFQGEAFINKTQRFGFKWHNITINLLYINLMAVNIMIYSGKEIYSDNVSIFWVAIVVLTILLWLSFGSFYVFRNDLVTERIGYFFAKQYNLKEANRFEIQFKKIGSARVDFIINLYNKDEKRLLSFSLIEMNPKVLNILSNNLKDAKKDFVDFPDSDKKLNELGFSHTPEKMNQIIQEFGLPISL